MHNAMRLLALIAAALSLPAMAADAGARRSTPPIRTEHVGALTTVQFGAPWEAENRVTQGSRVGDLVFVAGQFSHNFDGRFIGEGDVARQTRQTFANLDRVLAGLGSSKQGIVELEVFLIDPAKNFEPYANEYKRYVGDGRLTVTLIGVTALAYPQELVEIRAVAHATPRR